ncbi:MAG: hypothetical protein AAGJ18_04810, partial [Bacteroidota bacterium]
MKSLCWTYFILLWTSTISSGQNKYDSLRTVAMTATINNESRNLSVQWRSNPDATAYSLYKKRRVDTTWGKPILVTNNQVTNYVDTAVKVGHLYEYRLVKQTGDSLGYGYLFSGIDYLPPQKRGNILLVVDSTTVGFIQANLTAYVDNLISEGWLPTLAVVAENASVRQVKSLILQYYEQLDVLNTVLLLGDIAVPHAGNMNPDGHTNHKGAWPADLYYGDIDGIWTDERVNNTSSDYPRLHNVPNDGRFDQDYIPSNIELAIGRLDFSELPIFNLDQYALLN